jgi:hypothetical protein
MKSNAQHVQHKHQMHDKYTPSLARASSPRALVSSGTIVSIVLACAKGSACLHLCVCVCVFVPVSVVYGGVFSRMREAAEETEHTPVPDLHLAFCPCRHVHVNTD